MKVHLAHQSFHDYVLGLTQGLAAVSSVTVSFITSSTPQTGESEGGKRTLPVPRFRSPLSPFRALVAVKRILDTEADVVHWQAAGNPWVDASLCLLRVKKPLVVTVHDMQPHPGDRSVLPGTFPAIRRLLKKCDHLIVHSEAVRSQAIEAGANAERISVIPHGELGSVYQSRAEFDRTPEAQSQTVLFFGRLQGYKGIADLASAMDIVAQQLPAARLVIAGAGHRNNLERLGVELPKKYLEIEPGFVEDGRVLSLFAEASLVALPYREASQSGVAALASGLGRAVVATDVGGLADQVVDGQTGLVVPAGDIPALAAAIVRVLSSPPLRKRLEEGAQRYSATTISWSSVAAQTLSAYDKAIAWKTR